MTIQEVCEVWSKDPYAKFQNKMGRQMGLVSGHAVWVDEGTDIITLELVNTEWRKYDGWKMATLLEAVESYFYETSPVKRLLSNGTEEKR